MTGTATLLAFGSAAVGLGAAVTAWQAARGNSVRASFELARSLYSDLTSKETAESRSALEFYRRATSRSEADTKKVMDHYFALLWQFERVYAGRESLRGQRRLNGTGPAVDYLDRMIEWHVSEWAARWLDIRQHIKQHVPDLDDRHSLSTFCDLVESIDRVHRVQSIAAKISDIRASCPAPQSQREASA